MTCFNGVGPAILIMALLLSGCSSLGVEYPFANDPLTGGVNREYSPLLNIQLPQGLQLYTDHSTSRLNAQGRKEGLETYRGNVDEYALAFQLHNSLKSAGWQLRFSTRKGDRAVSMYQKNDEYAVLALRRQGMLTILEIWTGQGLPDGADLEFAMPADETHVSLPGEEYGPLEEKQENNPPQGTVEKWGTGVEEKEL